MEVTKWLKPSDKTLGTERLLGKEQPVELFAAAREDDAA